MMLKCILMYFDRQYDAAGKVLNKSIEIDSTHFWAYYWLGRIRFAIGEMDKAIELLDKASNFPSVETISLGTIGYIYAQSGQTDKALKIFDQLIKMSEWRIVDPLYIAWIYLGLNDRDNTFQYLDQAYDGLSSYLMMINVDPFYDDLRRDERFQQLLQKMGFGND